MDFTRYRINIVARILLILVISMVAFIIMLKSDYWTISIWLLLIVVILTFSLIRFFERSRRQLYQFVSSIRSNDFSPTFYIEENSQPDVEMNRIYNEISSVFRNLRDEKEFHYQYLQMLIEHVNIAIVCFTEKYEVQFCNQAALDLFGRPYLHNLASFERISVDISNAIEKVKKGDNQLLKVVLKDDLYSLTVSSAEFRFHGHEYKLITFYDIKPELERQELESWKKLIRTITHEVNNSAIPITNLTRYVSQAIVNDNGTFNDLESMSSDQKDDLKKSLVTIENRSDGLVNFINSTRNFTKIQKPDFHKINLKEILSRVLRLLESDLDAAGITVDSEITPDPMVLTVDPALFEQLFINLILNSIDALSATLDPRIAVSAIHRQKKGTTITISDNGKGIKPEEIGNIFVPYFTTRASGSGLGLSICRNIVDLHKGQISVRSVIGTGTTFTIQI